MERNYWKSRGNLSVRKCGNQCVISVKLTHRTNKKGWSDHGIAQCHDTPRLFSEWSRMITLMCRLSFK